MRQCPGNFTFIAGHRPSSKFVATFIINKIQYIYSGTANPNPGPFKVNNAVLTYGDTANLTATRSYTGQVGISKIKFTLKPSGVSITGDLPDSHQVGPASTVDSSGTWTTA
ncbi:hypothetical protein FA13DRAFT_1712928 [Coprinellus micaceus]|uniref:Uncharacterized protein n=1 Tax=Coprinellus micaceus TaxID=71717 RepID=A0A4Y7SYM0_COPMI|nr:hypothetical protein FA13DRAFT_1712928 [Coprinellus micaceus]